MTPLSIKGNLILAGPVLTILEYSEVFTVGDIAWIINKRTNKVLAQLGSVALQTGNFASTNIEHHQQRHPHPNNSGLCGLVSIFCKRIERIRSDKTKR